MGRPSARSKESTIRSRALLSLLFACALVGAAIGVPASADTEAELEAAEQQLDGAQAELDRLNQLWQEAEADLARSQDAAEAAERRIASLEANLATIRQELNERAAALFIAGGSPQALALLTSQNVDEAADRLEFASAVAEGDSDLATQVSVETQELEWEQDRLAEAVSAQIQAKEDLEAQQDAIQAELDRYASRVDELEDQLAAERAAAEAEITATGNGDANSNSDDDPNGGGNPPPVSGTGWIQTCPVNGATSFVDSFGDPRPGGRSHAGIDMIAARGTPVVAVHSGTVHRTGSNRQNERRRLPRRKLGLDLLHAFRLVWVLRRGRARRSRRHDRLRREHRHDRLPPAFRVPPRRGCRDQSVHGPARRVLSVADRP